MKESKITQLDFRRLSQEDMVAEITDGLPFPQRGGASFATARFSGPLPAPRPPFAPTTTGSKRVKSSRRARVDAENVPAVATVPAAGPGPSGHPKSIGVTRVA